MGFDIRGLSVVELMVALAILSVGVVATLASFKYISISVQHSKGRTLANNLGQEQVEKLKNLPYYTLLVTTSVYSNPNFSPAIDYDTGNYPPQTLLVGGIPFIRGTRVDFAFQSNNSISTAPWTSDDTALKEISVYVMWQEEGSWQYKEIHNLMANPAAPPLSATYTGTVKNGSNQGIAGARVVTIDNPNWFAYADSGGVYRFNVSPGTYTLQASSQAFYTSYTNGGVSINSGQTLTQNFTLTSIASGTATGNVYKVDHLVISQVVASTDTANGNGVEFVELYNPTPNPIAMGLGDPSQGSYWSNYHLFMYYFDRSGNPYYTWMTYISSSIAPNSYYLIANTTTVHVGGVTRLADAVHTFPSSSWYTYPASTNFQAPNHMLQANNAGGIYIYWNPQGGGSWITEDKMGWAKNSAGNGAPSVAVEGNAIPSFSGLQDGESLIRMTDPGNVNSLYGRAYDTDDNRNNFLDVFPLVNAPNTGSQIAQIPIAGTPATGAIININDPLSNSTTCSTSYVASPNCVAPGCPVCTFSAAGISTGTWIVDITSGVIPGQPALYSKIQNVVITVNTSTGIPNGSTLPSWTPVSNTSVVLSAATSYAFVSGFVYDGTGSPLNRIEITDNNGRTTFSASTGKYMLLASTGSWPISANPLDANVNRAYTAQSLNAQTLLSGLLYDNQDFNLTLGGILRGYFQTASNTPLPGRVAIALDGSGLQKSQAVSDNTGYFYLTNLATGTYTVQPSLDPAETCSPVSLSATLTSTGTATAVSTFTVTNGLAQITGQVQLTNSSTTITTGVLVIATTATLAGGSSSPPPSVSGTNGGACSPCYYAGSSDATGSYTLNLRSSASAYKLYGWYTQFSGITPTVTRRGPYSVSVSTGGQIVTQNLSW